MQITDLKKNLRILVLARERSGGNVISGALHAIGFSQVTVLVSTMDANTLFLREKFDVMMVFLSLRDGSGFEFIRQIRAGEKHIPRDQTVVLVETEAEAEGSKTGYGTLGINAIAQMPLTPRMLEDSIKYAISHEYLAQEAIDAMGLPAPQPADEIPKGFSPRPFMLPAEALVESMFLAEDITVHGHTLVPAGTMLAEGHLLVIESLRNILENREFKVYLKSSR